MSGRISSQKIPRDGLNATMDKFAYALIQSQLSKINPEHGTIVRKRPHDST